jgi:hypothetical protein
MRMLVEGPCQFQGHPEFVEQRPTTGKYGRYSDECQASTATASRYGKTRSERFIGRCQSTVRVGINLGPS